jgi:ElaB/YqjD/DUF883 family membrane-anchored ribosome-binding protein
MSLCTTQTSFTDSELSAPYTATPALLPSPPSADSDRDATGMLKESVVASTVTSLKNSGVIPAPNPTNPDVYVTKQTAFIANVKAEYCYYESRYKYALNQLFTSIANGYPTSTPEIKTKINTYLAKTQGFNRQLNDLTQIMNATVNAMMTTSSDVDAEIKQYNAKIKDKQTLLNEQNRVISSSEASMRIKKDMVKYTEEKARNTNNLLNVYAFLNIVTLGLLVYVYKAVGDD